MYPIATSAETYGRTEEIVGNWMQARGNRDKLVVATKIVGPNAERFPYIRGGTTRFNRQHIAAAVDTSLQRLKTDVIDLYQLHRSEERRVGKEVVSTCRYRGAPDH